jgi:hypothetical protein
MTDFQDQPLSIINVGIRSFADNIASVGGSVEHVDWQPPANGNREIGFKLAELINHQAVEAANKVAFDRYAAANPVLVGIGVAARDLPDMDGKTILHAGPPVAWEEMCGPMKGAIIGAALYEGWADDPVAAE